MITYLAPGYPASLFEAMADVVDAELVVADGMSGPSAGDDPLGPGRADLAWVCSTAYVGWPADGRAAVSLAGVAWVPADDAVAGAPAYFSDVVVRRDSTAAGLADLAGLRIGCNDPVSLSGHHALRFELVRRGLARGGDDADRFADLVMTGGHLRSVDQLLVGDVDAALLDGVLLATWARRRPEVAGLRIVERLGPWPTQPLVAADRLGREAIAAVRVRLLAADAEPALRRELDRAGLARLVEVGRDHCAPVAAAMAAIQSSAAQSGPK
jgi:ABC-type phosphate/phosphonate transport system substrate-binding protein